jgi:hypothetical protein
MWYRVFCRSGIEVSPAALVAALDERGLHVGREVRGDSLGWTAAAFTLGQGTPVHVERFLTDADDLRDELNTWAAFLETLNYSPNSTLLMERVIQTRQLVTVRKPVAHSNEVLVERVCETVCQVMATRADGIYQIEDHGWYAADGTLLVEEY